MSVAWKVWILRGIGLFLFWQWFSGNLSLYIHARFSWLTLVAALSFVLIGGVYHTRRERLDAQHHHGEFAWGGFFLILTPILFGLLAPGKPLGADAMRCRSINVASIGSTATPITKKIAVIHHDEPQTILDWVMAFWSESNLANIVGAPATVSGFVYRDQKATTGMFMVGRFVITCCAADATPVGLYVAWPNSQTLSNDQWVEVSGHFELQTLAETATPVLVAEAITVIDMPEQPYLYP